MDARAATLLVDAATSRAPVSLGPRRTNSTHEFYRYPARFTPELARAVIDAFTSPGELVLDPFVGGGTTLVESRLAGRIAIGNDVNRLATFVARVKTTLYSASSLTSIEKWSSSVPQSININVDETPPYLWDQGYLRNFEGRDVWRLRKFIATARDRATEIDDELGRAFVRCAVLRTAQWALDMRDTLPSIAEFRDALISNLAGMAAASREYARGARRVDRSVLTSCPRRTVIITGRAQDLPASDRVLAYGAPRLVLTSPPYPGVYVNYHRWKLRGRRETPLPFWIVSELDGQGLAYYTMGARAQHKTKAHLTRYFQELREAFAAIASLCDTETVVVQVVGFSNPEKQLPRYLGTMKAAGLREICFGSCATAADGRLWRDVPGRRWWTRANGEATAREVVLFHRLRVRSRPQ